MRLGIYEYLLLFTIVSILMFMTSLNLMTLLLTACIYLTLLVGLLLLADGDIYTGFLYVIDLGVGLIFFIFILHFTTFLHQKSNFNVTSRQMLFTSNITILLLTMFYYVAVPYSTKYFSVCDWEWALHLHFTDYILIHNTFETTELNTLAETYFTVNSLQFFKVNFIIFFGVISAVVLQNLVQRIFAFLNTTQIINHDTLKYASTNFFHRSQSTLIQITTPLSTRIYKNKKTR